MRRRPEILLALAIAGFLVLVALAARCADEPPDCERWPRAVHWICEAAGS